MAVAGCHSSTSGDGTPTPTGKAPTTSVTDTPSASCSPSGPRGKDGAAPLLYFRRVTLAGSDVAVKFVGAHDDTASLQVSRPGCSTVTVTAAAGKSATALGVTFTVQRLLPSTGGKPPQVEVAYRFTG